MTCPTQNDPPAVFDLPLHAAHERIADLHATAAARRGLPADAERRPFARLRDALGARLIDLGAAVAADEGLRRRPVVHS